MALNEAMFNDNGQCGYILKPNFLRDLSICFNPNEEPKLFEKLNIKIISAQNLPSPEDGTEMKTFVKIKVYGIPSDNAQHKTETKKMGFGPIWDDPPFSFQIHCPELAFIKFTIKDEITGTRYGEYCVRYINMREGMKTKNSNSSIICFVNLVIWRPRDF
jgi:phosphatidylinositol phospholipase C delta